MQPQFEKIDAGDGTSVPDVWRLLVPGGWIYYLRPLQREPVAVFVPDVNASRVRAESVITKANEAEGTLHGAELLLSIASVMDNAGQHITLASKRREAIAWACRIAAAKIPELVKAAEESHRWPKTHQEMVDNVLAEQERQSERERRA